MKKDHNKVTGPWINSKNNYHVPKPKKWNPILLCIIEVILVLIIITALSIYTLYKE